MSKVCEICGKAPVAGRSISHSHRVTNRWFRPNIQKVTIKDSKGRVRKANIWQGRARVKARRPRKRRDAPRRARRRNELRCRIPFSFSPSARPNAFDGERDVFGTGAFTVPWKKIRMT